MSTRLLVVFSLIACVVAAYLYTHKDTLDTGTRSGVDYADYWANDIKASQTDAQGNAELSMTAAHLSHDPRGDVLSLNDLQVSLYQHFHPTQARQKSWVTFSAQQATWQQPNQQLLLSGDVTAARFMTQGNDVHTIGTPEAEAHTPVMLFTTAALQADIKNKTIHTQTPVNMTLHNSTLTAEAMTADLTRGDFTFDRLQAQYAQ